MIAREETYASTRGAAALAVLMACAVLFVTALAFPQVAHAASYSELKLRAATLETDIGNLKTELEALEVELQDIITTLDEVDRTEKAYRESQLSYQKTGSKAVTTLYKIENSPLMFLDSLVQSDSLTDALKRIDYFDQVRSYCIERIEQIKVALEALEKRRAELNMKRAAVEVTIADKSNQMEQAELELETVRNDLARMNTPGRRIAAAAVALAGCAVKGNSAPGPASYYGKTERTTANARIAPPRSSSKGDWSTYLDVYAKISNGTNVPNHACCDCFPVLAVLWSGVDDGYLNGKYPSYGSEFNYLSNSPKWERVGGKNGYWYRNPPGGVNQIELQPGDILATNNPEKDSRHWMVYVGHDVAAARWGEDTVVDCVEEGYRVRWANGKPLSSRKDAKWAVFRRNTTDYSPENSKWADFMKAEKELYL